MTGFAAVGLRDAGIVDVPDAALLLHRVCLRVKEPLLGSVNSSFHGTIDVPDFVWILHYALLRGRVEVATDRGRLVGVACWILHPACEATTPAMLPRRAPHGSAGRALPARLAMLDLVLQPPEDVHQHLACLGTRAGHGAREIAEGLLRRRGIAADRYEHALYTEVRSGTELDWLARLGYRSRGPCLGDPDDPDAYLMHRPPASTRRHAPQRAARPRPDPAG